MAGGAGQVALRDGPDDVRVTRGVACRARRMGAPTMAVADRRQVRADMAGRAGAAIDAGHGQVVLGGVVECGVTRGALRVPGGDRVLDGLAHGRGVAGVAALDVDRHQVRQCRRMAGGAGTGVGGPVDHVQ